MNFDFTLLQNKLNNYIETGKIAGNSLIISFKEEVIFSSYQGFESIEKKKAINKDSIYRLASMTKPITATAILICQEQGLLNVEDNISKYLPKFKKMYLNAGDEKNLIKGKQINREVKITDILTHTAGFGGPLESPQFDSIPFDKRNLKDDVDRYASFLLPNNPGEIVYYSGVVGFDILARIVEVVSKMNYEDFLNKYIFIPLGMSHTSYKYNNESVDHMVMLYKSENEKLILEKNQERSFDCIPPGEAFGGAGLLSTIGDYSKFAMMLANNGIYKGKRILKDESVKLMSTAYLDITRTKGIDEYSNWGLGVYVRGKQNKDIGFNLNPHSFGWSGAYGTHFFIDPSLKLSAVYMHNSSTFGGAGAPHTIELEKDVIECLK